MPDRVPYFEQTPGGKPFDPAGQERQTFYHSTRWKKHRAAYLAKNPLCAHCQAGGRITAATVVHHSVERLDDPSRAFDWTNYQALCRACHTIEHNNRLRQYR